MKQKLIQLQKEIDKSLIKVRNANTPLLVKKRASRQKTSSHRGVGTVGQMNLIDIYRTLHPTRAEDAFCSSAHRTFTRADCFLGHKMSLNKFKMIQVTQNMFSDHSGIEL